MKKWLAKSIIAIAGLAAIVVAVWHVRHRGIPLEDRVAGQMQGEPHTMLWAWETPEDLRTLDPRSAGVAFLAAEIVLDGDAHIRPRQERLVIAPEVWAMAVVRLEPAKGFADTASLRTATAKAILQAAGRPGVRGVQIDFDATLSQRAFYAAVLREVRQALPATMPLSMTALVSWCGATGWLDRANVDEAVPMFFRMGGPAAMASAPRSQDGVQAAGCSGSVGVSTDESWPQIGSRQRVYVFRRGPWTNEEIARVNAMGYVGLNRGSGAEQ